MSDMLDPNKADVVIHDLPRQITRDIYEHEVLLSFRNDLGAYLFDEWWNSSGKVEFERWVRDNPEPFA